MTPRHMAKVAGAQGARERPLRPPSGPSRAARTPVRERMFNRMDRMFKQNEHSLGCSSWIVAIQSLSGDSRRSAWRTCQHQPLTDPNTSCATCAIRELLQAQSRLLWLSLRTAVQRRTAAAPVVPAPRGLPRRVLKQARWCVRIGLGHGHSSEPRGGWRFDLSCDLRLISG